MYDLISEKKNEAKFYPLPIPHPLRCWIWPRSYEILSLSRKDDITKKGSLLKWIIWFRQEIPMCPVEVEGIL